MVIAIIVVLAVVVFVAMGGGGELSAERSDHAPLDLGPVSATDVVLLRPPTALWGYDQNATDEAMEQIAESIRERDIRIVALEQLVTDLSRDHALAPAPLASSYEGARHRRQPFEETRPQPQPQYPEQPQPQYPEQPQPQYPEQPQAQYPVQPQSAQPQAGPPERSHD
jgi:hypothetical protein